ncbi:hypothetical protein [Streptomyces sp. NPDC053542]|uniref:hypothetical protein n=1 Tax=Streptomyces sp. NPDC053542 TaxID=3365710 RepID=UPI0037CDB131
MVSARAGLDTPGGDESLWRYRERLVEAVAAHDAEAAAAITNESLPSQATKTITAGARRSPARRRPLPCGGWIQ